MDGTINFSLTYRSSE